MASSYTGNLLLDNPEAGDCNWDIPWHRNQGIKDALAGVQKSINRIVDGGILQDAGGLDVSVSAGSGLIGNKLISWAGGSYACDPATIELTYKTNWLYVLDDGIVYISTIQPTGEYILLGFADVDQTSVIRVADLRSMYLEPNYLPGINKLLLSSANIADVFIYDTSKDSDFGAWRDRCQGLSWYNEALNTATRGKTRKFPAVAAIVAEINKVTIFDLTDPSAPMWMVFNSAGNNMVREDCGSATMLNGVLSVGSSGTRGVQVVGFLSDSSRTYIVGQYGEYNSNIIARNSLANYVWGFAPGIVDNTVNDVAITMIGDAPIDPITGIAVPTIAVGTDGGVSVIDGPAGVGTVVDLTEGSLLMSVVSFIDNKTIGISYSGFVAWNTGPIPAVDSTIPLWRNKIYQDNTTPALLNGFVVAAANNDVGCVSGLTSIYEGPDIPENGMVDYTTNDYFSGIMQGDIRLATLADTIAGDIVGGTVEDRCVKNNILNVIGTITKAPVAAGAELQGYGGFSATDRIEQPYTTDLDFGTGDFHIMAWVNPSVVNTLPVFSRGLDASVTSMLYLGLIGTSGLIQARAGNDTFNTQQSVSIDTPTHLVLTRRSGELYVYINATVDINTAASAEDMDILASSYVGVSSYDLTAGIAGVASISLVRVGAGAPTDEQILEIYNLEKKLFEADAKCTLQGTSTSVKTLSYDEDEQALYAGTANGITRFDGLTANLYVDELTTSDDNVAISANKGTVVTGTAAESTVYVVGMSIRDELASIPTIKGASGQFTSNDGKTITVENGIITEIV